MNHRLPVPSYRCQGCGDDVDLCAPNSPTDEELRDELTCGSCRLEFCRHCCADGECIWCANSEEDL